MLGLVVVVLGACDADPLPPCAAAYEHLVTLARRNPEPEGEARFVEACVAAWDPKRVDCLTAARTVSDALQCKPIKKRPG